MTRRRIRVAGLALAVLCAGALFGASRPARGSSAAQPRIVTVAKVLGIGWFERMQQGIDRFAVRTGVDATMTGGHDASPATQIRILRRLIAAPNRPAAITVVPNSPQSLEPVLAQARAAGIKVVTHEASNQMNTDVDIEAFDNKAFGTASDGRAGHLHGRTRHLRRVRRPPQRGEPHGVGELSLRARPQPLSPGHAARRPDREPRADERPPTRRRNSC